MCCLEYWQVDQSRVKRRKPHTQRATEYNFKRIGNKRQFNLNVNVLDDIQESIHNVENNDTESTHSFLSSISNKLKKEKQVNHDCRKAEAGWLNIEEYHNGSAASNSDDLQKNC